MHMHMCLWSGVCARTYVCMCLCWGERVCARVCACVCVGVCMCVPVCARGWAEGLAWALGPRSPGYSQISGPNCRQLRPSSAGGGVFITPGWLGLGGQPAEAATQTCCPGGACEHLGPQREECAPLERWSYGEGRKGGVASSGVGGSSMTNTCPQCPGHQPGRAQLPWPSCVPCHWLQLRQQRPAHPAARAGPPAPRRTPAAPHGPTKPCSGALSP